MSDNEKQKKYQFTSNVRLPNINEIMEAASDFSAPNTKNLSVSKTANQTVVDATKQPNMSQDKEELQKLGMQVADIVEEQKRQRKAKEEARAAELRRLREERDEIAQKKLQEEQAIADEEKKKSIQEAKERAAARKEAERLEAERLEAERLQAEQAQNELDEETFFAEEEARVEAEAEQLAARRAVEEESVKAASVAENFWTRAKNKLDDIGKEKPEFKETVLKEDYEEEMDFREDSSEEVDSDYWDF